MRHFFTSNRAATSGVEKLTLKKLQFLEPTPAIIGYLDKLPAYSRNSYLTQNACH